MSETTEENGGLPKSNGDTPKPKEEDKRPKMDAKAMSTKDLLQNLTDPKCKGEFLQRSKETAEDFLKRTYIVVSQRNWQLHRSTSNTSSMITALIECNVLDGTRADRYLLEKEGKKSTLLKTTLCEDIFLFLETALKKVPQTVDGGNVLVEVATVYFRALQDAQREHRDDLMQDQETCCASSNGFCQMAARVQELGRQLKQDWPLTDESKATLDQWVVDLASLYDGDADFAAQMVSYFVFQALQNNKNDLMSMLFTGEWMRPETHFVRQIIAALSKNMADVKEHLDPTQLPKAVQAMCTKYVHYYLEQLLRRTTAHKSLQESYFDDNQVAMGQIHADIEAALAFFLGAAEDRNKPLIEAEFELLDTVHTILTIAAGLAGDEDLGDSVKALQARVEKYDTTYYILGDLYHLVNPQDEKKAYEVAKAVARNLKAWDKRDDPVTVPGLSLRTMLSDHLVQSRGHRTRLGAGPLDNFFGMLGKTVNHLEPKRQTSSVKQKLTYEELEKELEEATERANQAEERVEELQEELDAAKESEKRNEEFIKVLRNELKAYREQQKVKQAGNGAEDVAVVDC